MASPSQDIASGGDAASAPSSQHNATTTASDTTQTSAPATASTSQQISANASATASVSTSAVPKPPPIYHGIMEGYSVQFADTRADPSSIAVSQQYGQYTPPTMEDVRRMREESRRQVSESKDNKPQPEFPIMDLPTELRLKVWEAAIVDDTIDLIDFCHDHTCSYEERADHPWYKARCFFVTYGPSINGVPKDYHPTLKTPGLNLLLINKTVQAEVRRVLPEKRRFNIQAASLECAQMVTKSCPYVKSVAFPIPAFANVIDRLSFAGRTGVQWWARYIARHLAEFPENTISRVLFWAGERPNIPTAGASIRYDERMIYHRLEFVDVEAGKERWNIRFLGSF